MEIVSKGLYFVYSEKLNFWRVKNQLGLLDLNFCGINCRNMRINHIFVILLYAPTNYQKCEKIFDLFDSWTFETIKVSHFRKKIISSRRTAIILFVRRQF